MIKIKTQLVLKVFGLEVGQEELERLVRNTLGIEPLGEIFQEWAVRVSGFDRLSSSEYQQMIREREEMERTGKKVVIAVVNPKAKFSAYIPKGKLIYCGDSFIKLAHEIGHALGLNHPSEFCNYGCESSRERDCQHLNYIMGCRRAIEGTIGFRQKDVKFLRREYA